MSRFTAHGLALRALPVLAGLWAGPGTALALTLEFDRPATVTATTPATLARHALPLGPWVNGILPTRPIEGLVSQTAWRLDGAGISTLELLRPLRLQLEQAGYRTLFDCATAGCGGFDFRFALTVLPEPAMHVDLGDFQFVSAEGPGGTAASLLVSRSASAGHVQLTVIALGAEIPAPPSLQPTEVPPDLPPDLPDALVVSAPEPPPTGPGDQPVAGSLAKALESRGAAVLEGLDFASGADTLRPADYPALTALADWLRANPDRQVALVGHTDASGALEGNISLSRRRAAAVRALLIADFNIPPAQLEAQGVGYLAPLASNLTEAGRTTNRRVEAIVTSTR